jgi:hypothetical protein
MTTDALMIGVNQDGNSAATIDLDIGWVRVMEDLGFKPRTADVGGPLLSTVTPECRVEADNGGGMNEPDESIGQATMRDDQTIVLNLRAEGPSGIIGHAQLVYPRSHAEYCRILRHLGGLDPGESKLVPPWPDAAKKE